MGFDVGGGDGPKGRSSPDMNVTPLVDVVLVLLIIFMVITPMLVKQFMVRVPEIPDAPAEPRPPDENNRQAPSVRVLENGRIRLDSVEMSDEEFLRTMPIAMRGQPSNYIRFDADDSANYGRTVEVMDLARRAGVVDIAVITDRMRGRAAAPTVPSGSEAIPTSIAPTR